MHVQIDIYLSINKYLRKQSTPVSNGYLEDLANEAWGGGGGGLCPSYLLNGLVFLSMGTTL